MSVSKLCPNWNAQSTSPWLVYLASVERVTMLMLCCDLKGQTSKLEEKLIFGNIEQQQMIVNIYSDILEERENLQQRRNNEVVT